MQPLPLSVGPSNWLLSSWHLIALEPGWVLRHKFPRHSSGVELPPLTDKALAVTIRGTWEPSAFCSAQERRLDCILCRVNRSDHGGLRVLFSLAFPPSASLPQTKKPEIQSLLLLPTASDCITQASLKGPSTQHRFCCKETQTKALFVWLNEKPRCAQGWLPANTQQLLFLCRPHSFRIAPLHLPP